MRFDKSILHLPWYKLYLSYLQRATTKKVVATIAQHKVCYRTSLLISNYEQLKVQGNLNPQSRY
jgi:hypothetical protein